MENLLVPYQAVAEIPCSKAVVLAPHPDDEIFGCGGAILRHLARGNAVRVIVVSDGAYGLEGAARTAQTLARQQESRAAAAVLGCGAPEFWGMRDREVAYGEKLVRRILESLEDADLVYAPSVFEMHPDHRALGMAAVEAVRRCGKGVRLALYEVGMPLRPNLLLDISDLMVRKQAAMACFVSQNAIQRYDLDIAALNRYRTYTLPDNVTAAEAYILTGADELAGDPFGLYQSERDRQRALGLHLDGGRAPLVSIIIRSMDRPTLTEALDSVALQTYPNIEVVLVNAKGAGHREAGEWCGRFPLRMVSTGQPLPRSRAANLGLDAAHGEYLIFLDDDDWFDAGHIDSLVREIERRPDVKVAYSGARCVDGGNNPLPTQFGLAHDATQLLAGNYIPIHTALFSRTLLDAGCRVDESLDLYEDWDFWIQASMLSDFLYVEGNGAVYRVDLQSGFGVVADSGVAEKASLVLFKKWLPRLEEAQVVKLMHAVRLNRLKDQQLTDKEQHVRNLEGFISTKDRLLEEKDGERDRLLGERDQLIGEKDRLIGEKDRLLGEAAHSLAVLENRLQEKTSRLSGLERALDETLQHVRNLEQFLEEKDRALQERDTQIHAIVNSISWRWTASLRHARHQAGKALSGLRAIHAVVARSGGLPRFVAKSLTIFRHEGVAGLRKRLNKVSANPLVNAQAHTGESVVTVSDYQEWTRRFDTLSELDVTVLKIKTQALPEKPLISILLPVFKTPEALLRKAIDSVLAQIYPHWELCIADDASGMPTIQRLLAEYGERDSRIKVMLREVNGHISAASNSALELATGRYVALLDHDDELAPSALYRVVEEICANPDAALVYSDEDKIDLHGVRSAPYFKPDWNPDLFLSQNFICHLAVYRTDIVRAVGGFRPGLEGSQDYDLALRVVERIKPEQIRHIPRILYHWRMIPGSTALGGADEKPYAVIAALRALDEHLARQSIAAKAMEANDVHGMYRVRYALPENPPLVSLIIPTRNGVRILRQCVESITEKTDYPNYEILVVDNGSDDRETLGYLRMLEQNGTARVIRDDRPFNYPALNNGAVRHAKGEIVGLLNNDVEVISASWLSEMVSHARRPEIGAVGARLWYPNDTLQHGGVILVCGVAGHAHKYLPRGEYGYFGRAVLIQNYSAVTAACLVMRKEVFLEVGGLDENLAVAFNDVDFCLRIQQAGYRNLWTPYAELYHHESLTRGHENSPEKIARFNREVAYMQQRWGKLLLNDPAYNPNLTWEREDFSLAWPPRVEMS